ncbi:biliverdin-producing heme oxygenase [Arhodomonas sp. KWT]|uniref:biliverdin-producing heme oxygenase n=1 Tax=Arhodomonas sp. KWT TaxID=2679915 RepID=UPI0013CFD916|nr:biliverdin-producing heme oxygenase [Arhodomonas sp. KWT]
MPEAAYPESLLSRRLKVGTQAVHEALDRRITGAAPFADRQRYSRFLRVQLRLHHVTAPLYRDPRLQADLPGLAALDRLEAVKADCIDLGIPEDALERDRRAAAAVTIPGRPEALGWIYTHEGSRMGAAVLLREARQGLALSETYGARHMTAHTDGRAPHWRDFKTTLDAIALTPLEADRAVTGARAAFVFVQEAVDRLMPVERPAMP